MSCRSDTHREPSVTCHAGLQLFLAVSFWVLVVVLPTNLVGYEVSRLENPQFHEQGFAYWLSPPPPATAGAPPAPETRIRVLTSSGAACAHFDDLQTQRGRLMTCHQQCTAAAERLQMPPCF